MLPSATALFVAWAKGNTALQARQAARVGTKLPGTLPATRVQRISGVPDETVIDQPVLQVECWAADDVASDLLARTYIDELPKFRHRAASGQVYTYAFESGPYFAPDDPTLTSNARHIFTIRLLTTA